MKDDFQKIQVEIDGEEREAKVLNILELDGKEYVIYAVESDSENSDILYSEVVKDDEGFDTLVDVDDEKVKEKIVELVKIMFSEE